MLLQVSSDIGWAESCPSSVRSQVVRADVVCPRADAFFLDAWLEHPAVLHCNCLHHHCLATRAETFLCGLQVIEELIRAGCDLDIQAQNGCTGLHNAAANGHLATAKALINAACDLDIQNSNGNTALHVAASKGMVDPKDPCLISRLE